MVAEETVIGSIVAKNLVRNLVFAQLSLNLLDLLAGDARIFVAEEGVQRAGNVAGAVNRRFVFAGTHGGNSGTVEGGCGFEIVERGGEVSDVTAEAEANRAEAIAFDRRERFEVVDGGLGVAEEFGRLGLSFIVFTDFKIVALVTRLETGDNSLVQCGSDRDVAFVGNAFGHLSDVSVDAKDFLKDYHGGKRSFASGLGEISVDLQIAVGNFDTFGPNLCLWHNQYIAVLQRF